MPKAALSVLRCRGQLRSNSTGFLGCCDVTPTFRADRAPCVTSPSAAFIRFPRRIAGRRLLNSEAPLGVLWVRAKKIGALRDDELGQEIDGHEMVIRTNQAPTLRYEEHVGKTTGMRILNKRWTDELGRRHIDLTKQDASNVRVVVSRANVRWRPPLPARRCVSTGSRRGPQFWLTRVAGSSHCSAGP